MLRSSLPYWARFLYAAGTYKPLLKALSKLLEDWLTGQQPTQRLSMLAGEKSRSDFSTPTGQSQGHQGKRHST